MPPLEALNEPNTFARGAQAHFHFRTNWKPGDPFSELFDEPLVPLVTTVVADGFTKQASADSDFGLLRIGPAYGSEKAQATNPLQAHTDPTSFSSVITRSFP